MGLHLHTTQSYNEAEITVHGQLSGAGLAQLQAAIDHFRSRGCSVIHLNIEQSELPLTQDIAPCASVLSDELEFAIR